MGGDQAAKVLMEIEKSKLQKEGEKLILKQKKPSLKKSNPDTINKHAPFTPPPECGPTPSLTPSRPENGSVWG